MLNLLDLCAQHEIPDQQGRGFTVGETGQEMDCFIIRARLSMAA